MNMKYEIITPSKAKEYLAYNICNYRNVDHYRVNTYANDMLSGAWQDNGESIKFGVDGKLLDGQHRLLAIVKAGVPIGMYVCRGVSADIFDIGKNRTPAQILKANSLSGPCVESASLGAFTQIVRGKIICGGGAIPKGKLIKYASYHAEDFNLCSSISLVSKKSLTRRSTVILAFWCMHLTGIKWDDFSDFVKVVNTGFPSENSDDSTPAIVLRNMLLKDSEHYTTEKMLRVFTATIDAFLDFRKGTHRVKPYVYNKVMHNLYFGFAVRMYEKEIKHIEEE